MMQGKWTPAERCGAVLCCCSSVLYSTMHLILKQQLLHTPRRSH
jgi:hypothetical protein